MELGLRMDGCHSLKDKRRVLQSLISRCRQDFHVAMAEVGDHELWNRSTVAVACVSTEAAHAESVLGHVLAHCDRRPEVEATVLSRRIEQG